MTRLLEEAFVEASKLSENEQDSFAEFLIAELRSEQRWQELFASRPDVLSKLADEALREHDAGLTRPLDELID